jgi:hypothetical protein
LAEQRTTDVARIADLPPLADNIYDEYNADYESDDLSDMGGAEGNDPILLQGMEYCLKQFAARIEQPKFSTFNKWKKV